MALGGRLAGVTERPAGDGREARNFRQEETNCHQGERKARMWPFCVPNVGTEAQECCQPSRALLLEGGFLNLLHR